MWQSRRLTPRSICSSPLKSAAAANVVAETTQQPSPRITLNDNVEKAAQSHIVSDGAHQVADDIQRELELQQQRQQQEVVSAAMQAMGALPPNAVFKVCKCLPPACPSSNNYRRSASKKL